MAAMTATTTELDRIDPAEAAAGRVTTIDPADVAAALVGPPSPETTEEPTFTIAQVAERLEITAHTLRYYERIGLLDIGRDSGGRRRYTTADIARVVFITRLRATALPIARIQHYFALVQAGPHTEPERLALLEAHRDEVRAQLSGLESALAMIEFKIATYGGSLGSPGSPCPS